jgi:PIN domain nuclease of toxin-antitoxin system
VTRYLRDTHIWLWLQSEPDRLPDGVLATADPVVASYGAAIELVGAT